MCSVMPRQQQGMMIGPMKGHMAPNSSPFKPTINKLSSQYMIQDHMSNHYMKLETAKSAIDSKPPKSMVTSVKKRDQMRREAMAKQMKLFDFEKEMKHGSGGASRQSPDLSTYGSQRLLSATVTKTGYEPRPQSVSSYRSGRLSPRPYSMSSTRPRSASSPRSFSGSNPTSPRDKNQSKKQDILSQTYGGDYLDRHEDRFKNTDTPFTPRLKKRSGKSFLSQSKHYAAPLVAHKETKRKVASKKKQSEDISPTSSHTTIQKDDKLDKSVTKDEKIVEERTENLSRLSLDSKKTYDNIYGERSSYDGYGLRHGTASSTFFGTSSLGKSNFRTDSYSAETKNRIEAEEEEMKYLEFINAVTNDILTRGIYSDRVLTQVMQRHLNQNKGRLKEKRMRRMLIKLQEDLGISTPSIQGFESSTKYSTGYDVSSSYNYGQYEDTDGGERSLSRASMKSKPYDKRTRSTKKEPNDGRTSDASDDKTYIKGILKTSAASSGSEIDLRSVISSGDENEKQKIKIGATEAKEQGYVDPQHSLTASMKSDMTEADLSRVVDLSDLQLSMKETADSNKEAYRAQSIKSNSAHSLGSMAGSIEHEKKTPNISDLDDF